MYVRIFNLNIKFHLTDITFLFLDCRPQEIFNVLGGINGSNLYAEFSDIKTLFSNFECLKKDFFNTNRIYQFLAI